LNTQTHLLIAGALFAKNGKTHRRRNTAIFLGALIPDIIIFIMAGVAFSQGVPQRELWGSWYFQPPWETWIDAFNSLPIYALALVSGILLYNKKKKTAVFLMLFASAALIHIAADIPFHVDDGHAHFWPFNQWRYQSSISYWDPQHFGTLFGLLEALLGLILVFVLWKRFKNKPDSTVIRCALGLFAAMYVIVPVFFLVTLGQ